MNRSLLCLLNIFFITLYLFACLGCHSQKYTPANFEGRQLIFGNGGGFTGKVTQYTLLENGQLFITNTVTEESNEIGKIDKPNTKQLFKQARNIEWGKYKLNQPGNIYYFIKLKEDRFIQEAIWGNPQQEAPQEIQVLYDQLLDTIKQKK